MPPDRDNSWRRAIPEQVSVAIGSQLSLSSVGGEPIVPVQPPRRRIVPPALVRQATHAVSIASEHGTVKYQSPDGELHEIARSKRVSQSHPAYAALELYRKSTWARYTFKSALHKELRRSDTLRGALMAGCVAYLHSTNALLTYAKRVPVEDTRNIELLHRLATTQMDGTEAINMLIRSPKMWDVPIRADVFRTHQDACVEALRLNAEQMPSPDDVRRGFETEGLMSRLTWLWRARWADRVRNSGDCDAAMMEAIKKIAKHHGGWAEKAALLPHYHTPNAVIEVAEGFHSEAYHELQPAAVLPARRHVPDIRDYVFDIHTAKGSGMYRTNWRNVSPGVPPPQGMDPRWSAMWGAELWRTLAFEQFGPAYKSKRWEEVSIPLDRWEAARAMDRYSYPKVW